MRLSLRTKQVLGVTALVGMVVVVLSLIDLGQQARVRLEESQARGVLLAQAIYQRAFAIVPEAADPYYALREDGGMRNILEASIYSKGVTYAAIVDTSGIVIAHYDPEQIGKPLPDAPLLEDLIAEDWSARRRHTHRHLDAARQERAAGDAAASLHPRAVPARGRDARRVAPGAVAAPADPRVAQRPQAPRARRARGGARFAAGRVRRARQGAACGQ
jgi:hypothetical protein